MNVFKKIMSTAVAVATIIAGTAFPVSADYDCRDIDQDGYIGTTDLIILSQYLNGINSISNYNRLDVNQSLTVDGADYECLRAYIFGSTYNWGYFSRKTGTTVASPTVSGFTPNSAASSTVSREYMRYDYINHHTLSNYTLTPTLINLYSGINSRGVIGIDDRYVASGEENSGIVKLSTGTGFIVGDHVIATAAHCVYNMYTFSWISNISINTYDNNGNIISNSTLTPVEAHIPEAYYQSLIAGDGTHPEYDYALVTVEEDLSDYVHFSLGTSYNVNNSLSTNVPIYVTGCPDKVQGSLNSSSRLYSAEGGIIGYNVNDRNLPFDYEDSILTYNVDVTGGQSGGPVYTITKNIIDGTTSYTYTALAVNAYDGPTHNFGPVITNPLFQFYNNNPNINYQIE